MKKKVIPNVQIAVWIPITTRDKVELLLTDPIKRRPPYGAWSGLVAQLLQEWVDRQIEQNKEAS